MTDFDLDAVVDALEESLPLLTASAAGVALVESARDPEALLRAVIDKYGSVNFDGDRRGQQVIDFSLTDSGVGTPDDMSFLQSGRGGTFGSSVVLSDGKEQVVTATLRLGKLDLPSEADPFIALTEYKQVVQSEEPPTGVEARFREIQRGPTDPGEPYLHIEVTEPVSTAEFASFMDRVIPTVADEVDRIVGFATEIGSDIDV